MQKIKKKISNFYVYYSIQLLSKLWMEYYSLLLMKVQLVENDKLRNGNREALTALRKKARTTKTSVPSPFESLMKIGGSGSRPLVHEVCATCGNHDPNERTWMMFPGTDIFASIPFHAAHSILEEGFSLVFYVIFFWQAF